MTLLTTLLIVDAQQGLLDGPTAVPDAPGVVDRLVTVLSAARDAGARIIHLQNDGAPGTLDEPGTPGWHFHPKMAPLPGEIILRKTGDDGFAGTDLAQILARRQVDRLAVIGLLSEMCVSATIRGALARQLHVVLVRDAHATYDLEDIPAAIVSRVAEHALGDTVEIVGTHSLRFGKAQPTNQMATASRD